MNSSEDFKSVNNEKFTTKEKDILEKNKNFFSTDRKYIDEMLQIIDGKSNISIRVLDWFVANYSKKNNTVYKIKINGKDDFFYVNNEYKKQLNGYSKQYFDPFCRKKKIIYTYHGKGKDENNINFYSSIGQLNFFQWAIRNKIIVYVQRHLKEIEKDMKEVSKLNKERRLASNNENDNSDNLIEENNLNDEYDPVICSSDKITSLHISSCKSPAKSLSKTSSTSNKSDSTSSNRNRRHQLSRSVYDFGIKKSNIPIKLDFD
ncbi:MAG: hypothetical protein Satyrvirus19_9 [Satyrvirus sp.]|uniref:Uncharacterized protein n=1 Tax=Satyrvirus sp. TaxID=2487771 RepID=A0A3G5AE86_9VIRU|nr:MAG: hypothetical protein Satyrvirus19_9 [Satyrvirus sp.]